jgi:pyruvate/2-oxoglutarate/acetoin dehydrogenase E1 component
VAAQEAVGFGLVTVVVDPGGHLDRALELAEGIAGFPQETMLSDRRSAIEGSTLPLAESLAYEAEIGKASIERAGTDVTIIATLQMVGRALDAANKLAEDGIEAEVIDLRWVRPIDWDTITASVAKTGRLVIAEEQWHEAGWGSTIISRLAQAGTPFTSPPVAVSLPDDLLIPYSPPLEDEFLPSADRIAEAARNAVRS